MHTVTSRCGSLHAYFLGIRPVTKKIPVGAIMWVQPTCGRANRGRHAADRADFVAVAAAQHLQQQTVEYDRFRVNLPPTFNTIRSTYCCCSRSVERQH